MKDWRLGGLKRVKTEWTYYEPVFECQPPEAAAWAGHRRFAYDLVRNLEPTCIVELGVCLGISFCAFCQAVKDARLSTELWAVDTWAGDVHTGLYGPEFLASFERSLEPYRALNVRQVRTTFDEARPRFRAASVDLLHIDGCHTYDAVRHDYDTWKDVVTDEGIILFHDIAHRDGDFGVYRLWEELQQQFSTISFVHSHGLGVLFKSREHERPQPLAADWLHHYGSGTGRSARPAAG